MKSFALYLDVEYPLV